MSIEKAKRVLKIEAQALKELINKLDNNFSQAVEIILSKPSGRVVVTGMGKSGIIGKKISATLSSTGTPSIFLHPVEGIHGDLGMVTEEDVILAISNSGETEEINDLLPFFKKTGNPIIAFTGESKSNLAKQSDAAIDVGVEKEACPWNLAPTASTTAALAMGDALAIALLEKRGFKKDDFARLHPGGSLGKRLMLKVKDVMRTGKGIPIVSQTATMEKAIAEITRENLGFTIVVDESGKVKGIITDGDLRRAIQKRIDFKSRKAGEVMTLNPKTIDQNKLAAQAVEKMEKYSITSLIIVDNENRPEGTVHLHDLLGRGGFKFEMP